MIKFFKILEKIMWVLTIIAIVIVLGFIVNAAKSVPLQTTNRKAKTMIKVVGKSESTDSSR